MKALATITAAILLTACGGESSSSNEQAATKLPQKVKATYQAALKQCGNNLAIEFDDLLVSTSSENIKAEPIDNTATAIIEGTTSDICIAGEILSLKVSGTSNDIFVNGNIGTLEISGTSNDIYIFGSITTLEISGTTNDVYTEEVAVYDLTGTNNDVMNISDAKL